MQYSYNLYLESLAKLEYIESAKELLCKEFSKIIAYDASNMTYKPADYLQSTAILKEIIDDIFCDEIKLAKHVIEDYCA